MKKIILTGVAAASVAIPVVSMAAPSPVYALDAKDQKELKQKFRSVLTFNRISQDTKNNTSKWKKYVKAHAPGYTGGNKYVRAYISFNGKPSDNNNKKCQADSGRKWSEKNEKIAVASVTKSGSAWTTKNAMNKKIGTAYAKYGW